MDPPDNDYAPPVRPGGASGRPTPHRISTTDSSRSADPVVSEALFFRLADAVLATGAPAVDYDNEIVAVPDVMAVESMANGHPQLPTTATLVRDDGRTVMFCRIDPNRIGPR